MSVEKIKIHVGMVSWQYFPLTEGGSEKQCRKIVREIMHQKMQYTVITAFIDRTCQEVETDGHNGQIVRLGPLAWVEQFFRRFFDGFTNIRWLRGLDLVQLNFWAMAPFSYVARLSFMMSLRAYLRKNHHNIDILHVHEAHWIAGAVAWASRGLDIPVVCKEATFPPVSKLGYDTPFRKTLTKLRLNLHFIALTESVRESLLVSGIKEKNITLIPNGVDIPSRKAEVLNSQSVVYIGNFTQGVRQKAFDVLFQAWVKVHAKRPDLSMVVLGGGDYSHWQQFLKKNHCQDSVEFKGTVSDVGTYLEKARLFVLPSRVEGLSNALLEAMSWGVPVAVSDIAPHRNLVKHKRNGFLFPVNDSESLAQAIIELTCRDDLAIMIADEGRKTVAENYGIEKIVTSLIQLYKDLLNSRTN